MFEKLQTGENVILLCLFNLCRIKQMRVSFKLCQPLVNMPIAIPHANFVLLLVVCYNCSDKLSSLQYMIVLLEYFNGRCMFY